ncbi:MAG: ATP-binding protein [Chitinophagaceae bacterium]
MAWDKVIAQQHLKIQLQEMVSHNRLSHALLFLGKEGSGALPLAVAFAQYVVSQPKPGAIVEDLFGGMSNLPTSDDEFEASKARAENLIHPDLHFSFPVIPAKSGDKPISANYIAEFREFFQLYPYGNVYDWLQFINAENKQGNITAEECLDIIKKLSLKSFEAQTKVLVMWMPEYLGKNGNKLLKLIEEPPANTLFILVAENEEAILPTILSRCQLVKVPPLDATDIEAALIERAQIDANKAKQIANIAEGNYREALQLIQHASEDWQDFAKEWLRCIVRKLHTDNLKFIEDVSKLGREKQKQFLRYFNHLLEQSVRVKALGTDAFAIAENELDFALRINKIASVSQIEAMVHVLDNGAYYVERNANAKMLFMAMSIKLFHIIQNKVTIQVT